MAADAIREKLEEWRRRTGRKPMKRFSYVAEYCPTDLSIKLATPSFVTSKSTIKRKPLSSVNSYPNHINVQIPDQINIKLCFVDDSVSTVVHKDSVADLVDPEITIKPFRRRRHRSFIVETDSMFASTAIQYTTAIPRIKSKDNGGLFVTPVKRSTRRRSVATPGYLEDQKSCYSSPSDVNTSETVVVLPNKYLETSECF